MMMKVAVFLTIAISAQLANGAKLNVQSSKATGNDIVADQWLVQLKNCSNVVKHKAMLMEKLIESPEVKLLHFYHFGDFCGYALKINVTTAEQKINFQQKSFEENEPGISSTSAFLAAVRAHQDVISVHSDMLIRIAGTAIQYNAPWNLQRICQRFYPLNSKQVYVYDDRAGAGVDVYVIDSGILLSHPEYEGRAMLGINLSGEPDEPQDVNGHGTHVAGIIGSKSYGVAKRVNLISVRALSSGGVAAYSTIIAGVEYVVKTAAARGRPSIINLSSAGPQSTTLNNAFIAAVNAGIHVVVSAGNSATDACRFSPANIRFPGATVVGSVNQGTDQLSSFSNFGACVTINAPGDGILSTYANPPNMPPYNKYTAWSSGTSQASPHVAGVKALYLAAGNISPADLEQTLIKTATTNRIRPIPLGTFNGIVFQRPY